MAAAEPSQHCGVGRFEWRGTCRTCTELKCKTQGCKDRVGCTACPEGSFIGTSVNGVQHCRLCKDNGCSAGQPFLAEVSWLTGHSARQLAVLRSHASSQGLAAEGHGGSDPDIVLVYIINRSQRCYAADTREGSDLQ